MHSAVMQNAKYIKFAEKNTVEVISLGSLQQGVDKQDRLAATYTATRDGKEVELMVEYPNLTLEEMLALNSSPGGQYNKTGKIPYTSIVDPHTLEEVQNWSGGQGAGTIMDAVNDVRKAMIKEHGKPTLTRRDLSKLTEAETDATELIEDGEFSKALDAISDAAPEEMQEYPMIKARVERARSGVVKAAEAALKDVEALIAEDPRKGKSALTKLTSRLKGTGLEDRAAELANEASGD